MAGLELELEYRAKQKLMEYLAGKISRRFLRGGFESSMNHRFLIATVYDPHILVDFSPYRNPPFVQRRLFDAPRTWRKMVRFYHSCSPVLADDISKHDILKTMMRFSLLPIVGLCRIPLKISAMAARLIRVILGSGLVYFLRLKRLKSIPPMDEHSDLILTCFR